MYTKYHNHTASCSLQHYQFTIQIYISQHITPLKTQLNPRHTSKWLQKLTFQLHPGVRSVPPRSTQGCLRTHPYPAVPVASGSTTITAPTSSNRFICLLYTWTVVPLAWVTPWVDYNLRLVCYSPTISGLYLVSGGATWHCHVVL